MKMLRSSSMQSVLKSLGVAAQVLINAVRAPYFSANFAKRSIVVIGQAKRGNVESNALERLTARRTCSSVT